jgi:hypothetical protein
MPSRPPVAPQVAQAPERSNGGAYSRKVAKLRSLENERGSAQRARFSTSKDGSAAAGAGGRGGVVSIKWRGQGV